MAVATALIHGCLMSVYEAPLELIQETVFSRHLFILDLSNVRENNPASLQTLDVARQWVVR